MSEQYSSIQSSLVSHQHREIINNDIIRNSKFSGFNYIVSSFDIWSIVWGSSLSIQLNCGFTSFKSENYELCPPTNLESEKLKVFICTSIISDDNIDNILSINQYLFKKYPNQIEVLGIITLKVFNAQNTMNQLTAVFKTVIESSVDYSSLILNKDFPKTIKKQLTSGIHCSQIESNSPGEDRMSIRILADDIKIITVIDGHGGFLAADLTLSHFLDNIVNKLLVSGLFVCDSNKMYEIINSSFIEMDELILQQALNVVNHFPSAIVQASIPIYSKLPQNHSLQTTSNKKTMFQLAGCCVVVAIILGDNLYIGHVG